MSGDDEAMRRQPGSIRIQIRKPAICISQAILQPLANLPSGVYQIRSRWMFGELHGQSDENASTSVAQRGSMHVMESAEPAAKDRDPALARAGGRLLFAPILPRRLRPHVVGQEAHALIIGRIQPEHPVENVRGLLEPVKTPEAQPESMHAT